MKRWFQPPPVTDVHRGDYRRWDLGLDSASDRVQFLEALGRRVIETYLAPLEYLSGGRTAIKIDVTEFVDRLFDPSGNVSDEFVSFGGEVVAAWADESFAGRTLAMPPAPHESRPAFDAISLAEDQEGIYICLIQGKTTPHNASNEANLGARQLGRLERGDFQRELAAALESIARRMPDSGAKKSLLRALTDPSRRRYVVSTVHEQQPPTDVLGNYDRHIPGAFVRRTASFIRFNPWQAAWQAAGNSAHVEASRRSP